MKKFIKSFSLFLVCSFFVLLFSSKPVSANYEDSKNNISISAGAVGEGTVKSLQLTISITYQRGISMEHSKYMICSIPDGAVVNYPTDCTSEIVAATPFIVEGTANDYISKEPASKADKNLTKKTFTTIASEVVLDKNYSDTIYVIFVKTSFCAVREMNNGEYTGCQYWHDNRTDEDRGYSRLEFKVGDVIKTNITNIGDEELKSMMDKISSIVMDIVMPVIYAVLGLFLVVKGSLLGFQIVKAADEPQIRQEKIGSLKWLIIGVAIAFAASGLVHVLMGFFSGAFKFE